jgi:hypothetical protein
MRVYVCLKRSMGEYGKISRISGTFEANGFTHSIFTHTDFQKNYSAFSARTPKRKILAITGRKGVAKARGARGINYDARGHQTTATHSSSVWRRVLVY